MNPSPDDACAPWPGLNGPWFRFCRWFIVLAFSVGIAIYVHLSWHWPLLHDTTVIHYVSFLIDKGWSPYRQIGDMNMPGAYLFEGWALHLFGASDLGWRLYDYTLSAILILAMISIARRYDWLAGLVAGGTFVLVHASEGAMSAGQRDQLMAVLLIVGYAFCFESVRSRRPWMMFPFALACGMAASVKPTLVPLGPLVLLIAALQVRRQGGKVRAYVLWALGGAALASAVVVWFLISHGAMAAFVFDLTEVLPHYATVGGAPWSYLLEKTLQRPLFIYVGFVIAAALLDRNWGDWECQALLLGVGAGLLNFYGQHKGFGQHRYTTVAFVVLWGTIQIFLSLRGRGYGRWFAVLGLAFLVLVNLPRDLQWAQLQLNEDGFAVYLEHDLSAIGTSRLQGQVQCLDIVDGCLKALFHLKIVQSTGSTGDLLLFLPTTSPVIDQARAHFLAQVTSAPPDFYVLSNQAFMQLRSFGKVDAWPEFRGVLARDYRVVVQREFDSSPPTSHPGQDSDVKAYRILVRNGVTLPDAAFK